MLPADYERPAFKKRQGFVLPGIFNHPLGLYAFTSEPGFARPAHF